jgi:hypothetical protein
VAFIANVVIASRSGPHCTCRDAILRGQSVIRDIVTATMQRDAQSCIIHLAV